MEFALLVLGMAAAFFLNAAVLKINEMIENAVVAVVEYFCLYIIVSGILFWADIFGIVLAEGIALGIECFLLAIVWRRIAFKSLHLEIKKNLVPLVICAAMSPLIAGKFELYGMGQDEGVYQTQAIAFLSGDTKNQQEIESYCKVPEEGREESLALIKRKLVGFYLYDDTLPTLDAEGRSGEASGFYHGVPTFSAILALWGSIAGMEHMAGVQSLLYFCAIFLLFYAGGRLKMGVGLRTAGTVAFALSPITIWVCKSSLTEMMLACMVLAFLYFLMEDGKDGFIAASAIPLLAFSFFHMTIYTVMPVIMLIYLTLYLSEGKGAYLAANAAVLAAFTLGMDMMAHVAATYSYIYNFKPIYHLLPFVNQGNVLFVLMFCGILGIVLSVALYAATRGRVPLRAFGREAGRKAGNVPCLLFRAAMAVLLAANFFAVAKQAADSGWLDAFRFSTLAAYGLFTGIILIVFAVFGMIIRADKIVWTKNGRILGILFLYFILIYSAVFRRHIAYYYYYGRYLAPYLPCIILPGYLAVAWVKNKLVKRGCFFCSLLLVFVMALRYDSVLIRQKDDTRLPWQVFQRCRETVEENDAVIVGQDVAAALFLPLMHATGAEIHIEYGASPESQSEALVDAGKEGDVYFITDQYYGMPYWESVYTDTYVKSEDDNAADGLIPFPKEMGKEKRKIYVYRYFPQQRAYSLGDRDLLANGFHQVEGSARWTKGRGRIYCYLEPGEYTVRISQGSVLPWEELGRESMKATLWVNGEQAGDYMLTAENYREDLIFHIPAGMVRRGRNEVMLESETWSPADIGRSDTRILGISMKEMKFEEKGNEDGKKEECDDGYEE